MGGMGRGKGLKRTLAVCPRARYAP